MAVRLVVIWGENARAHTECFAGRRKVEGRRSAAGVEKRSDVDFDVVVVDAMGGCRKVGVSGG
eukprot:421784-Pleurochrysis_carterae.AAC.1